MPLCVLAVLGSLTGLAPRAHLSDRFVSDPSQHFTLGQSVRALVMQRDAEQVRCQLPLRPVHACVWRGRGGREGQPRGRCACHRMVFLEGGRRRNGCTHGSVMI